jgi:hypothetical protein
LATILSRLSTAFDPRTERPIAINPLPGLGSPAPPGADPWLSSSAPRQPADINVRSDAAAMQDANPQPAAQQEMRNAWPQPLRNRWPYAMRSAVPPSIPSARPPPHFNLIPANGDDADKQAPQQQMPLQQYQRTQPKIPSAALGTELAAVRLPERPSTKITGLEPRSEQEFSQLIEAYRRLKEAEGRQPSSGQPSPQPPPNENGVYSYASVNDAPSLGHRLVQGSIETLVPGAHYQELARQQLGAGNYVGAGVYQAAALLDAALGIATLGLSTRLAAAGRTAAAEGAALFRRAFDSKSKLLSYLGKAPEGMQWHHIVEQCQAAQFGQRPVQSIENIVALPEKAHRELNAFYSSKQQIYHPNTVREWLRRQSFEAQYEFGMEQLKRVLGY